MQLYAYVKWLLCITANAHRYGLTDLHLSVSSIVLVRILLVNRVTHDASRCPMRPSTLIPPGKDDLSPIQRLSLVLETDPSVFGSSW